MRTAYRTLAYLIALGVVFQAAVVAFGTFGFISEVDAGAVLTADSEAPNAGPMLHAIGGMMVIPALTLLLVLSSFFAKVPGGIKWALLVLLAVVVQINLGFFAFGLPAVGLLHGANAFAVLALALTAARAASRADAPAPVRPSESRLQSAT